jgi:hypothetical protein
MHRQATSVLAAVVISAATATRFLLRLGNIIIGFMLSWVLHFVTVLPRSGCTNEDERGLSDCAALAGTIVFRLC